MFKVNTKDTNDIYFTAYLWTPFYATTELNNNEYAVNRLHLLKNVISSIHYCVNTSERRKHNDNIKHDNLS